jgi:glycosyltransferase involved in cell wall biosynthesis
MNFFGYYVLNLEPTILAFLGQRHPAPDWLKPVAVIEHVPWWHGRPWTMLKRKVQQLSHSMKGLDHHLMVHAADEERMRKLCGVRGAFVSQNIYVDCDSYRPQALEKEYDAIYVAQMKPFKRHHLAAQVKKLYIATAWGGDLPSFCRQVSHATFNEKRLDKAELAAMYSRSHCSLALSAVEGAMLASYESLLCGTPVVTTASRGGRDEFFDKTNSIIVEANEDAVFAAVEHFKSTPPDPEVIRAGTLARTDEHRRRFCRYVADLISSHGGSTISAERLYQRYFGKPGGMSGRFIWADTFDKPDQLSRVQND